MLTKGIMSWQMTFKLSEEEYININEQLKKEISVKRISIDRS